MAAERRRSRTYLRISGGATRHKDNAELSFASLHMHFWRCAVQHSVHVFQWTRPTSTGMEDAGRDIDTAAPPPCAIQAALEK